MTPSRLKLGGTQQFPTRSTTLFERKPFLQDSLQEFGASIQRHKPNTGRTSSPWVARGNRLSVTTRGEVVARQSGSGRQSSRRATTSMVIRRGNWTYARSQDRPLVVPGPGERFAKVSHGSMHNRCQTSPFPTRARNWAIASRRRGGERTTLKSNLDTAFRLTTIVSEQFDETNRHEVPKTLRAVAHPLRTLTPTVHSSTGASVKSSRRTEDPF
jgi:hypothetical protein